MTKCKKIAALLAVLAMGATAAAGVAMSTNFHGAAFADTGVEDEVTPVPGSEQSPVTAVAGVNTISHMVVGGNEEMGFKELVYYMTFTPASNGVYTFTHSNPDVGVGQIYSENDYPDGEWDDSWTVYSVELIKDVEYTLIVNNFDWSVILDELEVGTEYELSPAETITIAYASAAEGSTWESAIPYTVGDTIYVSQGHAEVWYSFEATDTEYYLISMGGSATAYEEFIGDLEELASVTSNYDSFTYDDVVYICVTPSAGSSAEVQVLVKSEQTDGSCIVKAIEINAGTTQVGDGKWYTYTAVEGNKTASVTPVEGAEVIVDENGSTTLCGSVDVYDGYNYIGTLYNGTFIPAILPEVEEGEEVPVYTNVELTAGKTYNFHAKAYEYEGENSEGEAVTIDIMSLLAIA